MKELLSKLKQKTTVTSVDKKRDDLYFVTVDKEQIELVLSYLKQQENFTHLAFLQAVDLIEENKFQLIYMLYNYDCKINIGIRVFIDRVEAEMTSIHNLWPHAWQYQRELKEMFGIDFPGSPKVDESFVLEGWDEIPPMRRDFNTLEYSIKTFYQRPGRTKNDPKTHMRKKLYNNFPKSNLNGRKNV